jgi:hypothetical protein
MALTKESLCMADLLWSLCKKIKGEWQKILTPKANHQSSSFMTCSGQR